MNPWNVICPVCAAGKGQKCKDPYGYAMAAYHQPRINAAQRETR